MDIAVPTVLYTQNGYDPEMYAMLGKELIGTIEYYVEQYLKDCGVSYRMMSDLAQLEDSIKYALQEKNF